MKLIFFKIFISIIIILPINSSFNARQKDVRIVNSKEGDNFSKYPKNTMLGQLIINVYASKDEDKAITVLHDRPFIKKLSGIGYSKSRRSLVFVFEDNIFLDYGQKINESIGKSIEKNNTIVLFEIDVKTKKPVNAMEVPLKIYD